MTTCTDWKLLKYVFGILLILVIINFPFVFSSSTSPVNITSQGTISTGSAIPLHTSGIYIENALNQTVYLRGVEWAETGFTISCTGDWYANNDWLWGYAEDHWNNGGSGQYGCVTGLPQRVAEMKSAGFNVIRLSCNLAWIEGNSALDLNGNPTDIHIITALDNTIAYLQSVGMYAVLDLGYGGSFTTTTDFVNTWTAMANDFGKYPNVIFELWGEPSMAMSTWETATVNAMAAIRGICNNICVIQYGYCGSMSFVPTIAGMLTGASATNVVYSEHIYNYPAGATFPEPTSTSYTTVSYINGTLLNSWDYSAVVGKYPIFCTETGEWNAYSETSNELTWWANLLTVLNSYHAGYIGWEWGQMGVGWDLCTGSGAEAPLTPTASGQELISAIAAGTP
jgi:hypothetical protein